MAAAPEKKLPEGSFSGIFRLNPKGFGFIEPDDAAEIAADVFVAPGDTLDAITGDRVVAKRIKRGFKRPGQLGFTGRIVEILERGQKRFVGTYRLRGKLGVVKPDGGLLTEEIPVPDASSSGAAPNDKVVFELLKYPAQYQQAEAVIVEVLGPRGHPGVDTLAVIRQFDLPDEFSEEVAEAARHAVDRFTDEEIARRTDLRNLMTITIDPETARDYDDAVSIETLDGGITRLGVHIADVSFFVRPGEPLDAEAYVRGTSVYLPTLVVPMLPELLSNGMCSLQEGHDRLVKSAFIHLDREARVVRTEFANAVIRNKKRLTYEQVNEVLEHGRTDLVEPGVLKLLQDMDALARRILQRRRRDGYLELDLPSVDLVFDDQLQVIDARPEDTSFSHKIIEMFMVEANEAVARHLSHRRLPAMRRIHEPPSPEKLEVTAGFLRSCGHPIKDPGNRFELQKLLRETQSAPDGYPVHMAVLRSMMQAKYAVSDEGHWALASDCYCHFTSPIRRYPDLAIHRSLAAAEGWDGQTRAEAHGGRHRGRRSGGEGASSEAALREAAAHCSRTERRAEAAERELTKVKVLTLLEKHVGEEFSGVIAAVQEYGLFVEFPKYMVEGLVHVSDLRDDDYEYDRRNYCLIGRRSGRKVRIGDSIRVTIAAVDIPRRELDLAPAPGTPFATVPEKKAKHKAKSARKPKPETLQKRSNQGRRGRRR
jgi:ribonuclease R